MSCQSALRTSFIAVALLVAVTVAKGPTCSSPNASIIRRNNLSLGNKQYILDYHNKIRNYVASGRIQGQPKAANMIELRWSESLAKLSQRRADTCLFEHGDLNLNGEQVGQNLAIITSSANALRLNITSMIQLWFNEVFQFGYKGQFDPNSGHYSQLIWGKTREIGCGYTYYKEDNWYKMYFVCDYYPAGNVLNQQPYVYDKYDCKKYGLVESRKYSKLCEIDHKDNSVYKMDRPDKASPALNIPETLQDGNTEGVDDDLSAETTTDPITMYDEGDAEGNMEAVDVTTEDVPDFEEVTEVLRPATSNATHEEEHEAPKEAALWPGVNTTRMIEESMENLNETSGNAEDDQAAKRNGTIVLLNCQEAQPVRVDWRNKREFFKAATKLLDLLVNRKIYLSSENVLSTQL